MASTDKLLDTVSWRLCLGCGVCSAISGTPLLDYEAEGIRPKPEGTAVHGCPLAAAATKGLSKPSELEWGQILEIWEGHAMDEQIRFNGSSGGALTALAAYCIEQAGMHGVLHVAQDAEDPIRNRTRLSRSRRELLEAVGSRYSPGSVGNGLRLVAESPAPCVVIGRPAEIAAIERSRKAIPNLDENIGVTLSFFCAEAPSTRGTKSLLSKLSVEEKKVVDLKYRGQGWPGHFAPTLEGAKEPAVKVTYQESWAYLQAFRPWATHLWPDGSGESADISCGDPWYEKPDGKNPGSSLIVVRTERGRRILKGAIDSGYLQLTPAEFWKLEKSQANLLSKKGAVWGRITAMKLFGLPVPKHDMRALFHCWKKLSFKEKLQSTLGTVQRILKRKLYRKLVLDEKFAVPVRPAYIPSDASSN